MKPNPMQFKVAWFATKGSGTNEAMRLQTLLSLLPNTVELPFDKRRKRESFFGLLKKVREVRPHLLIMEGTGLAGGLICLGSRFVWGIPYVVSSGDAVGPFFRTHHPLLGWLFEVYERLLCCFAKGYIGWTPYLCGRAMAFGTRYVMTAPGWVIGGTLPPESRLNARSQMRERWGISNEKWVVGIVGSLEWNPHREWCYGLDLVEAMRRVDREDLCVVIVGGSDGIGPVELKKRSGDCLGKTIFVPGPVELSEVSAVLAAFDVASLPQSLDGVGSYRYTTKLPEYAAAGLPVITNRIPMAYDMGDEWMWKLPGVGPWEEVHVQALAELLQQLDAKAIQEKRASIPKLGQWFDETSQVKRVTHFIEDLLQSVSAESNDRRPRSTT